MTTALMLIPLMLFAAFGVDLASWYARISELQRAADAAALAGAVWMPNVGTATLSAEDSLRSNGIVHGQDDIEVIIERGRTVNSLRVTVTDTNAQRWFSSVVMTGPERLSRHAEAEYNLPLPLGSPLNFFGGDAARTLPPAQITWPSFYNTRVPATTSCNIGTSPSQNLGRWAGSPPTYRATEFDAARPQCVWTAAAVTGTGTTTVPPPDYSTRLPTNPGCRVWVNGVAGSGSTDPNWLGRWTGGSPSTFTTATFGTSTTVCAWTNVTTDPASIPPTPHPTPTNSPCRVGYETSLGWFNLAGLHSTTSVPSGVRDTAGNVLCRWTVATTQPPNPIDPSRSPGFWAAVEGPQTNAYQGEIFSTRCYGTGPSCGSPENAMYLPSSDPNRGFWYVVKIPPGLTGNVAINVFDGSYVRGPTEVRAGDRGLDSNTTTFPTRFQVYRQTNPLDFNARSALFSGSPGTTTGSCNWELRDEASFSGQWQHLCTLTSVAPGQVYLINVQTVGTSGAGVNGYALEAVANGSHSTSPQPALYAYASMAMQNNNFCGGSSGIACPPPPATFYLAEVGPQFAGRTLVMELWDPGDVSGGTAAVMTPMMPSTSVPRPVVPTPSGDCTWTADTLPNGRLGLSGAEFLTPQPPLPGPECQIETSSATSGQHFQGEWLRIRIQIPDTYTCTPGVNPETTAGSCWWGIRYNFTASANDVTTWMARIEGNPLQLTE